MWALIAAAKGYHYDIVKHILQNNESIMEHKVEDTSISLLEYAIRNGLSYIFKVCMHTCNPHLIVFL